MSKQRKDLFELDTIRQATQGDSLAMESIINHYMPYITKLSEQKEWKLWLQVNEDTRSQLVTKLMEGILKFDCDR